MHLLCKTDDGHVDVNVIELNTPPNDISVDNLLSLEHKQYLMNLEQQNVKTLLINSYGNIVKFIDDWYSELQQ